MAKFTALELATMTHRDLFKMASKMGLRTTVLVKVRSGQPHKRVAATSSELITRILDSQN